MRRHLACILTLLCILPATAGAQTSVGFTEPRGLAELLAYRLPTWGWQTWDVSGELNGRGTSSSTFSDGQAESSDYSYVWLEITNQNRFHRESENRVLSGSLAFAGALERNRTGRGKYVRHGRNLYGAYDAHVDCHQYLGGSDWFLSLHLSSVGQYEEQRNTTRYGDDITEYFWLQKSGGHDAGLGSGLGRLRDVTPLVRALRLSERLVALGRPRLTPQQIQQVAGVLAREYGYRVVFERPDRRFWSEVLDPLLAGTPLTVAEIFYLTDVMQEDLGPRLEGIRLEGRFEYHLGGAGEDASYQPAAVIDGEIARNLSLAVQIRGALTCRWYWLNDEWSDSEGWNHQLQGTVSWNLADRLRLDGTLAGAMDHQWREYSNSTIDMAQVRASTELQVRLEDRMSMRPFLQALWYESRNNLDRYYRSWNWQYGLYLEYRLDGMLF